jgi:hypothetical protein
MKLRIQVTVNGQTSWSEWRDEGSDQKKSTHEQEEWVRVRALHAFRRSLLRLEKVSPGISDEEAERP